MRLTMPLNLRETKRGKTHFFLIFHLFFSYTRKKIYNLVGCVMMTMTTVILIMIINEIYGYKYIGLSL